MQLVGKDTLTALFLPQKTENPSQEIPQPSSPLLQEEISISLKIFYFFFILSRFRLSLNIETLVATQTVHRPTAAHLQFVPALKNLLMLQINFGKVTSQ